MNAFFTTSTTGSSPGRQQDGDHVEPARHPCSRCLAEVHFAIVTIRRCFRHVTASAGSPKSSDSGSSPPRTPASGRPGDDVNFSNARAVARGKNCVPLAAARHRRGFPRIFRGRRWHGIPCPGGCKTPVRRGGRSSDIMGRFACRPPPHRGGHAPVSHPHLSTERRIHSAPVRGAREIRMKVLVFGGGGKMGSTVAFDLLRTTRSRPWAWPIGATARSRTRERG